jgi:ubiquinone/menaquinone biosynthesis C-methylase UbiE
MEGKVHEPVPGGQLQFRMTIQQTIPTLEDVWRAYDSMEVRLSAPLSERMLDVAGIGPGQRVLDLATGRGEPAIRAAHRVAPKGYVLGVDSAPACSRWRANGQPAKA